MSNVKLAIIYYSSTGTNYQLALWTAEGAEVKVLKVQELVPQSAINANPLWNKHADTTKDVPIASLDDLVWADAIIFSCPTRYGNVASQMKQFMDSTGPIEAEGKLSNKVVSAINPHGGQEATLLALYNTMYHWGSNRCCARLQTRCSLRCWRKSLRNLWKVLLSRASSRVLQ